MAKKGDNRPVLRITARLKDGDARFDLGGLWEPKFDGGELSDEQRSALKGLMLNISLDKTVKGIKAKDRDGKEHVLTNERAWFTLEPPFQGGGRGRDDEGDEEF